jgi:hypothetical protein
MRFLRNEDCFRLCPGTVFFCLKRYLTLFLENELARPLQMAYNELNRKAFSSSLFNLIERGVQAVEL